MQGHLRMCSARNRRLRTIRYWLWNMSAHPPHMASNTVECMRLMAVQAASQIHKVLSGQQPDWPVNRPVL